MRPQDTAVDNPTLAFASALRYGTPRTRDCRHRRCGRHRRRAARAVPCRRASPGLVPLVAAQRYRDSPAEVESESLRRGLPSSDRAHRRPRRVVGGGARSDRGDVRHVGHRSRIGGTGRRLRSVALQPGNAHGAHESAGAHVSGCTTPRRLDGGVADRRYRRHARETDEGNAGRGPGVREDRGRCLQSGRSPDTFTPGAASGSSSRSWPTISRLRRRRRT